MTDLVKFRQFFKHYTLKLKQFYPSKLPVTVNELDSLINEVLQTEKLPSDPTYHHAIASAVMHLGPITARKSKRYFAKGVRKSVANQAAFEKIQALREEEKKKLEIKPEVTPPAELPNGEPQGSQNQVVS